jgi:CBS domain-containing protein/tetratricopeptide (TPR) repeat protein
VSIDDLLRDLARTLARVPDSTADEAREAYLRACRQLDENPAGQQRIDDIADLLEAEETLYAQARAAADRGDAATAIPLLRKCAEAGTGEAAWLLAQLLEETGDTAEAMIWYQHASDDGDDRADEKLAVLRLQSCPLAGRAGSPREHHTAAPDRTAPALYLSHTSELGTWTDRALLSAATGHADQAAGVSGSYRGLLDWLVLKTPHHGTAPGEGLLNTRVVPVVFSCPDCDHLASIADVYRAASEARNGLAHDTSWVKARSVKKLIKMLRAGEPALAAECILPSLLVLWDDPGGPGKTRAAKKRALRWLSEDYSRPCPANRARLYAEGQPEARWAAREPVVANVMLPPSEVPACSPDTTVAQALEQLVQSGTQALPVCEMTQVTGIVTLADLARHISSHQGVPSATETIRALMRPPAIVPPSTPLPAIAKAIADDGIIVVSGSGDQPDGYLTAESLLTQAPLGASAGLASPGRSPLLIPGTGAVLLDHRPLTGVPAVLAEETTDIADQR